MKFRALAVTVAAVATVGLVACSSPAPSPEPAEPGAMSLDALIEAAKAEGSVMVYSADGEGVNNALAAAFEDEYGIPVETLRLTVGPLLERLSGELQVNVHNADVLVVADTAVYDRSADWFVQLDEQAVPGWDDYPEVARYDNFALLRDFPASITYNVELVPADEIPTSWEDMLTPFWKDHILLTDPRETPSYMGWAKVMLEEYGPDYLEGIADQNFQLAPSATPGSQSVAAGAAYAVFPSRATNSAELRAQGAPIDFAPLPGSGASIASGVLASAPHPNAARLYMAFQMSVEGNKVVCATNEVASFYPHDLTPECQELDADWVLPDFTVTDATRAEILQLLGLG